MKLKLKNPSNFNDLSRNSNQNKLDRESINIRSKNLIEESKLFDKNYNNSASNKELNLSNQDNLKSHRDLTGDSPLNDRDFAKLGGGDLTKNNPNDCSNIEDSPLKRVEVKEFTVNKNIFIQKSVMPVLKKKKNICHPNDLDYSESSNDVKDILLEGGISSSCYCFSSWNSP